MTPSYPTQNITHLSLSHLLSSLSGHVQGTAAHVSGSGGEGIDSRGGDKEGGSELPVLERWRVWKEVSEKN